MQGNRIFLPRKYSSRVYLPGRNRNYEECQRFSSAIENVNIKEFMDENKQKL